MTGIPHVGDLAVKDRFLPPPFFFYCLKAKYMLSLTGIFEL